MSTRKLVAHNFSPVDQARCIRNNLVEAGHAKLPRFLGVTLRLIKSMVVQPEKITKKKKNDKVANLSNFSAKIFARLKQARGWPILLLFFPFFHRSFFLSFLLFFFAQTESADCDVCFAWVGRYKGARRRTPKLTRLALARRRSVCESHGNFFVAR